MPRTAALLCVQNALPSLGWWIAHHVAAGFSTLLICDDHSTDGSLDLLKEASQHYDIRVCQTDCTIQDAPQRHSAALQNLLESAAHDLDWVLPLKHDEYFLPAFPSVSEMLHALADIKGAAFEKTTTIPMNWCICGLNGHDPSAETPFSQSPRFLYTRHALETFPDHRIVKSFFRPQTSHNTFPDPFSHVAYAPDWSYGRILHDAAVTSPSAAARRYYDRNEEILADDQGILSKSYPIAATLLQTSLLDHYRSLHDTSSTHRNDEISRPHHSLKRFYLGSLQRFLVIDRKTHALMWQTAGHFNPSHSVRLCLTFDESYAHSEHAPAWLYAEDTLALPYLPLMGSAQSFSQLLDILPVRLHRSQEGASLTFLPGDTPFSWQGSAHFPLFPCLNDTAPPVFQALQTFTHYGLTEQGIRQAIHHLPWKAASVLGAVSAHLPYEEAQRLLSPLLLALLHPHRR